MVLMRNKKNNPLIIIKIPLLSRALKVDLYFMNVMVQDL